MIFILLLSLAVMFIAAHVSVKLDDGATIYEMGHVSRRHPSGFGWAHSQLARHMLESASPHSRRAVRGLPRTSETMPSSERIKALRLTP
jgi:hypothetical protein